MIIKLLRFEKIALMIFLGSALPLLLLPISIFPVFYDVRYMALESIFGIMAIICSVFYFGINKIDNASAINLRRVLAVILLLDQAGNFGLYQLFRIGFQYDKFIHFLTPYLIMMSFSQYIMETKNMMFPKSCAIVASVILLFAVFWEMFEMFADLKFNTRLFGVYGLDVKRDTIVDLVYNIAGISAGWFVIKQNKGNMINTNS